MIGPDDDEDQLRDEVMSDLTSLFESVDKSGRGVCVQASTLGSLEALLDFLKVSKIPVSGINIGPVHKKDVMRASTMLEKARELACILCFDVPIDKDADRLAEEMGIRLFKGGLNDSASSPRNPNPRSGSGHYLPLVRCIHGVQCGNRRGEAPRRSTDGCLALQAEDHCMLL